VRVIMVSLACGLHGAFDIGLGWSLEAERLGEFHFDPAGASGRRSGHR
jgi:hypothetical protein